MATAIFDASPKFGNVVGVSVVAFAIFAFRWRAEFIITAVLIFGYFIVFYLWYRDSSEDPT